MDEIGSCERFPLKKRMNARRFADAGINVTLLAGPVELKAATKNGASGQLFLLQDSDRGLIISAQVKLFQAAINIGSDDKPGVIYHQPSEFICLSALAGGQDAEECDCR